MDIGRRSGGGVTYAAFGRTLGKWWATVDPYILLRCLEALAQWGKAAFQALIAIEVGKDDGDTLFSGWVGSITADKTQS